MARSAVVTPVSASISTPVFPSHFTRQTARIVSGLSMAKVTSVPVRFSTWQRGISSGVLFVPMIPAT